MALPQLFMAKRFMSVLLLPYCTLKYTGSAGEMQLANCTKYILLFL